MMKNITFRPQELILLISLFILGFSSTGYGQDKTSKTRKDFKLNDRVKQIMITSYKAVNQSGKIKKAEKSEDRPAVLLVFTENGHIMQRTIFQHNGKPEESFKIKYDTNGHIVKTDEFTIYGSGGHTLTGYKYDAKGNRIATIGYNDDGSSISYKVLRKYDEDGKVIAEKRIDTDDGDVYEKKWFIYNDHGHVIKEIIVNNGYKTIDKQSFEYDKNNRLVNKKVYRSDGNIRRTIDYIYAAKGYKSGQKEYNAEHQLTHVLRYDADGRKIEDTWFNDEGEPERKSLYKYDAHGNQTAYSRYSEGQIDYKHLTFYGDKGYPVKEKWFDADGLFFADDAKTIEKTYEYRFDSHNNWVKRITFVKDNPQRITLREIEYYPK